LIFDLRFLIFYRLLIDFTYFNYKPCAKFCHRLPHCFLMNYTSYRVRDRLCKKFNLIVHFDKGQRQICAIVCRNFSLYPLRTPFNRVPAPARFDVTLSARCGGKFSVGSMQLAVGSLQLAMVAAGFTPMFQ